MVAYANEDDSIVFVGYGKSNTPSEQSSTSSSSSSSKKRSIPTGSDKENQETTNKQSTTAKPSSSSSSSSSSSTQTQASKRVKLTPERLPLITDEKQQRKCLNIALKDLEEDPTREGATAMNGLQLTTVIPIRPDERFWKAGVKVSIECKRMQGRTNELGTDRALLARY